MHECTGEIAGELPIARVRGARVAAQLRGCARRSCGRPADRVSRGGGKFPMASSCTAAFGSVAGDRPIVRMRAARSQVDRPIAQVHACLSSFEGVRRLTPGAWGGR